VNRTAIQEFYESNPLMVSSPFGGVNGINEALFFEVLDRMDIALDGRRILDVGCGRGYMDEPVRSRGGVYIGADFVVTRGGFPLAQADAGRLPFGDGTFDGLFCIDAMEHFPDLDGAAREFRRVLKPGGFWFLSAPNYSNVAGLVKRVYEGLGVYEKDTWAPFRNWQPQELEQPLTVRKVCRIARGAGFRVGALAGHGREVGLGLFPWIDHERMPEAIKFRLQRLFNAVGPPVVKAWPGASLHVFYRFDV